MSIVTVQLVGGPKDGQTQAVVWKPESWPPINPFFTVAEFPDFSMADSVDGDTPFDESDTQLQVKQHTYRAERVRVHGHDCWFYKHWSES